MPTDKIDINEMAAFAMARSRVYGFLGALYNRLPDEQFVASLTSPEIGDFLSLLGESEDIPEDMQEGLRLMETFIHAAKGKPVEELRTELAVERTRLFRGIKPGYGPLPPYESVYAGSEQQPLVQAITLVCQTYAEAGVGLPEEVHEQPDYIGLELDFMRHLAEKETQAWATANQKEVMQVVEKERSFLEQHINCWVPLFCDAMLKDAQLDFYRGIARLTRGFLQGEVHTTAELVSISCEAMTDSIERS